MKGKLLGMLLGAWILSCLPNPAVDVGRLEPAEVVLLTETEHGIRIRTDTGAWGEGETLSDAVQMLKQSRDREVFLETADKLLLQGQLERYLGEICQLFRPETRICRAVGEPDLEAAGRYLSIHPASATLGELRAGEGNLETLILEEGRGILVP